MPTIFKLITLLQSYYFVYLLKTWILLDVESFRTSLIASKNEYTYLSQKQKNNKLPLDFIT